MTQPMLKDHRTCNGEGWHWSPNEGREVPCSECQGTGVDPDSEIALDAWRAKHEGPTQFDDVAKAMACDYDKIIINSCGLSRREIVVNAHRFSSAIFPDGFEEVSLDGVPFVRLFPVEFEVVLEDQKHIMKASRQYQVLKTDFNSMEQLK